ncbi:MAG: chemotaxis response regulator protein-glutamate methylesterase [Candidatus Wallbacteria bacterium HGW-Wallbacteria-1]|jgi:two-component system chemotaxis response regulator CheB|uniref:Protein-glutamate methylesterase/protein-glutamine glutaminase n=1 Tax=Candidatus Wallbacteria bacterium HGW-Wallbacteria-1 TaxID=2013854 RepID=A0A2N1PIZ3_9BACT|nr:MAG: chemotaxis response regulator protein-glutamate methylesterase [Candidatus Wallbacteria bacterium HGW-Wallbacteria-1]
MADLIRVLVVDDSALVRDILSRGLSEDPDIEVVGTARDPYDARDKIVKLKPDVMTLDVEMPRMDGVEFLRRLMPQYPLPTLMVSALTEEGKRVTMDALEAGAVDFVTKPSSDVSRGLEAMLTDLRAKVKAVARADLSRFKSRQSADLKPAPRQIRTNTDSLKEFSDRVIAIGASTGGTEAIRSIIRSLPASTPGIVIVQHMPAGFTKLFAERLNDQSRLEVREAVDGDRIIEGRALIAPGGLQLTVHRSGGNYMVRCRPGDPVNGHAPSVDVMMKSVSENVGSNAVGVILTGMGSDGADGLLRMRSAGAPTIGQNQETCVVYGMPKVAFERGAVEKVVSLDNMPDQILMAVQRKG